MGQSRTVFTFAVCFVICGQGFCKAATHTAALITDEAQAQRFMEDLDQMAGQYCRNRTLNEWNYASNMTKENRAAAAAASVEYMKFWKRMWDSSQQYKWDDFRDAETKRKFKLMATLGLSILPEDKVKKYNSLKTSMEGLFSTARVCSFTDKTKCDLSLEPEITELMMNGRKQNEPELRSLWLQWRNVTGKKMRNSYTGLSEIMNEVAALNKFSDASHYETRQYESPTFKEDVDKLWTQLRPFYEQLHAYVRRKLRDFYGPTVVSSTGPIPAHLLGNMWAQTWANIYDLMIPYKNKKSIDITPSMVNMTPRKMAEIAESFFVSLGFSSLPATFWEGSILEKPKDREMICHASSWDMCDGKNFWIKQCTRVNIEDLITLHHEMGHTIYQIQYKDLPKLFRDGANPGFHEAIGDLIALSVQTPGHLQKIHLLDAIENDYEADINYLMQMALEKIAFLPFGLLVDKWRWGVFSKEISPQDYNCAWWKLRQDYQGISPPETRTESDFDPGSKYHVAANVGYIRYFVSSIIQFQFHQALCKVTDTEALKPLHTCDIYNSIAAGNKLREMLKLGASKPWPEAMEIMTGGRKMDASAMLDYFQPLMTWLQEDNARHDTKIGWVEEQPACINTNKKTQAPGHSHSHSSTISDSRALQLIIVMLPVIRMVCW